MHKICTLSRGIPKRDFKHVCSVDSDCGSVLICQLPHVFHPSRHLLPSSPDVITFHHAVISLFLPAFPSTFPFVFAPLLFSHNALSKWSPKHGVYSMCVFVCAFWYPCKERYLSAQWSEEKTVCIIDYSLETGKPQIVKVNEYVSISILFHVFLHRHACFSVN